MLGQGCSSQEQALATWERGANLLTLPSFALLDGDKDVRGNTPVILQPAQTPQMILGKVHLS